MAQKNTSPTSNSLDALGEGNMARLLLRAARDFSALAGGKLRARGHTNLRMGHATLLANLEMGGSRITTLAERGGMTKQGMSQLVKELEAAGYLKRSADRTDRRAIIVTPTSIGLKLLKDVQDIVSEIENEYAFVLGEQKMKALRLALIELNASQVKHCDGMPQQICADD